MSPLRSTRHAMLAVAAIALASPVATAAGQALHPRPAAVTTHKHGGEPSIRVGIGGGLIVMQPVDEFTRHVNAGGGIATHFLYALDRAGVVAFRADLGIMGYGRERRRVPLSNAYGNLIRIDLTTTNSIATLGGGLQLMSPVGPVRPYVAGTAGVAWFWTQSTLDGDNANDGEGFARTTNAKDATLALSGTGGLYIPLAENRRWGLDIGATYHHVKEASYMHEGSVREVDGVPYADPPVRSRADMIVYRLGVRFGR